MGEETTKTLVAGSRGLKSVRWWLAYRLCWLAARLRGEKWYVGDSWHAAPGNRASELEQRIWQHAVIGSTITDAELKKETLNDIERDLSELSQAAGAAWGHIWPKDERNT